MEELKFDYKYKNPNHGNHREVFYSYDEKGNYDQHVRGHDDNDKIFIEQFWESQADRIENGRQEVLSGKKSPIYFHMEKTLMDPMTLSGQASISVWRVKRHFKPTVFARLSAKTLAKYAEAFNISIEQLKNIE